MNIAVISALAEKAPKLALKVHRKKLVASKNAPHIFFGLGIAGSVTSTVLACRATLKLSQTLGVIEEDLETIREKREEGTDDARDTAYVYAKSTLTVVKLYAPSVAVGALSIAALSGSHVALSRRNTALMAAYAAVSKAYDDYRARIVQELGEERELDIYHNKSQVVIPETGESVALVDPNGMSPYAKFFDEGSAEFTKNAELNRLFITCQQQYANNKLQATGHLFLNEVYDMLGIDRTSAGAVVGWVIGDKGDNYIDFGLYEARNSRFINGWEPRILLDFNVDGVIYDKI